MSIQSMTNTDTRDVQAVVEQIAALTDAGCQIVRCAVPDMAAASALKEIKKKIRIPLVADIHFDYRLALAAIESGVDKLRINPGNMKPEDRSKVLLAAKERGIPIRAGINSGSVEKDLLEKHGGVTPEALVESALRTIALFEEMDFANTVISIKASDIRINTQAHKLLVQSMDYPLHIGITEAGAGQRGKVKSAMGMGALLADDIGDTMRVSLTGDPVEEVLFAQEILRGMGMQEGAVNLVSCPTCGRTQVDLERIVNQIERHLPPIEKKRREQGLPAITVAVMGCAVNGPGEAREADLGVACGKEEGLLFQKGKSLYKVPEDQIITAMVALLEGTVEK